MKLDITVDFNQHVNLLNILLSTFSLCQCLAETDHQYFLNCTVHFYITFMLFSFLYKFLFF